MNTIDNILPEILWVSAVIEARGLRSGISSVTELLTSLWEWNEEKDWYRFSVICENANDAIESGIDFGNVSDVFQAFRLTYQLDGLDWAQGEFLRETADAFFERIIRKTANRYDQPYVITMTTVTYALAISGRMRFGEGLLPNLDAVVVDWDSDEAKRAAGFARATSMTFFAQGVSDDSDNWCRKFWRTNYCLSDCDLK